MAITRSAKKAHRASLRKRAYNLARRDKAAQATKAVKRLVADKKQTEARTALAAAQKALDKAVKKGTISRNTASRKKSRLAAMVKRAA